MYSAAANVLLPIELPLGLLRMLLCISRLSCGGGGGGNSSSILICLSLFFAHKQLSRAAARGYIIILGS
jgi:hypothetical protein